MGHALGPLADPLPLRAVQRVQIGRLEHEALVALVEHFCIEFSWHCQVWHSVVVAPTYKQTHTRYLDCQPVNHMRLKKVFDLQCKLPDLSVVQLRCLHELYDARGVETQDVCIVLVVELMPDLLLL